MLIKARKLIFKIYENHRKVLQFLLSQQHQNPQVVSRELI